MHPDRVARLFSIAGIYMLLAVLALRVVSLVNIAWQDRMGGFEAPIRPIIPSIAHYSMSPDGRQVTFEQQVEVNGATGWFSMPLEGGPATPSNPPETVMDPFLVRDHQLYLLAGDGYRQVDTSPRDTRVGGYARSPDGSALAFAAYRPGGTWGLYVLYDSGALDWLGDQDRIGEIAWSPDNQHLAFIAMDKELPQIYVARRDGQEQRQLTSDPNQKSHLRWSTDGRMLAFIEFIGEPVFKTNTPTPAGPPPHGPYQPTEPVPVVEKFAIAVVDVEAVIPSTALGVTATVGAAARTFLADSQEKLDLSWGMDDSGPRVVYALALPGNPKTTHLYALDPHSGQSRRVYPPQEITALACPRSIPGNGSGTVRITITNTSLRPADAHVLLRARSQRFPSAGNLNSSILQSENVPVAAGAAQTVEWPVAAQAGLSTHVSVLVNPNTTFGMDEERCAMRNTYDFRLPFLPNLPFLSLVLPLSLAGFLLCIPWLRKQNRRSLWALYLAFPLFIFIILIIEAVLLRGAFLD